ncbi:hypothetical protein QE250_08250 [Chromatiaceae bacterium AAb-1]|nr:hypothetical protein [Chromatiaceae bacterium AAb-1]
MKKWFSLRYTFEILFSLITVSGAFLVLHTFIIGQHYIIPTMILAITLLTGNLAWYGFKNKIWAKYLLFWAGFLTSCHFFFALFWAKRYREILGSGFEPVCAVVVIVLVWLLYQYRRRNALFK